MSCCRNVRNIDASAIARTFVIVLGVTMAGMLLAGCSGFAGFLALMGYGSNLENLSPPQQLAVDEVKQLFPDDHDNAHVLALAQADQPEVFGITPEQVAKNPNLAEAKDQLESQRAILAMEAATDRWRHMSEQATLNPPSEDNGIDRTALDSRRNEAAFGHPQF
jgi:hypothetical protein